MVFNCCVPSCKNYNKDAQMHSFPKDLPLYNLWIDKIGRADLKQKPMETVRKSYRICNVHFGADAQYVGSRYRSTIKKDAVPSLLLGSCASEASVSAIVEVAHQEHTSVTHEEIPSTSSGSTLPIPKIPSKGIDESTTPEKKKQLPKLSTPAKVSSLRTRTNLLPYVNTAKASALTPKARKMYKIASDLRKTARKLNFNCTDLRKKVRNLESITNSAEFLRAKLNKPTYDFVMSQLRCQGVHPKGRRYTLDEKIFFLCLHKQSPKGYRLFRKLFAAPSRKTLTTLLSKIPFNTGLNEAILESLKSKTKMMKAKDKFCSIIFDEMALDPTLQYNKKKNIIEGFQDNGGLDSRKPVVADKVMVFMARGICRKWKQPLAYYFNEGGMKTDVLAKNIKEVVRACQNAGLMVKAVICDQGTANVSAIRKLYSETREYFLRKGEECKMFGFRIGGEEVVPLYDPPHLLKGMRNNFFKYALKFKWRKPCMEVANWEHIKKLYEIESMEDDDYKCCKNLTSDHVQNTKKMKVSVAAQVFSNSVAAIMKRMAVTSAGYNPQDLPKEAESTAEFLLFMDKVFDSVNGSTVKIKHGKELKCAVSAKSAHKKFWCEAVKVFESMEFFNEKKNKILPPSLKNWIHTLKGFGYLWDQLRKVGVEFLCTRHLNQDPLENFFGSIRSHGVRNINPNAASFINSFKSLIINNFLSSHSVSFNCENDNNEALDNLKHMLTSNISEAGSSNVQFPEITIPEYKPSYMSLLRKGKLTYVAGFVAKKLLKEIKICKQCRKDLAEGDRTQAEYFMIEAKAYSAKALLSPSTNFNKFFQKCIFLLANVLPQICHYENLTVVLEMVLKNFCDEKIFHCERHNLSQMLFNYTTRFHLYVWIKNINRILKGKQKVVSSTDPIKIYAGKKFEKHQKYYKKFTNMKGLQ